MSIMYVPASLETYTRSSGALYMSPKKNRKERTEWFVPYRKWYTHHSTGYFGRISCKNDFEVDSTEYTKCVPVMGPAFCRVNGIDMVLVNPHSVGGSLSYCSHKDAGLDVICDSGGFQLIREKTPFVDPVHLAKQYNKVATIGMDLDVPDILGMDKAQWRALPRIQQANYEAMKTVLHKDVNICLVGHGKNVSERQEWFELVGREDAKYIAVAGLQREFTRDITKEMQQAEAILHACHLFPNAEYIHVLGTTTTSAIYIYSLISHLGLAKKIGADSASYALTSTTGSFDRYFSWDAARIPQKFPVDTHIPCSCPICSTIQDFRMYGCVFQHTHALLNLYRYFEYIDALTGEYLKGNINERELIIRINSNTLTPAHVRQIREYVEECKANKFKPLKRRRKLFSQEPKGNPELYSKYEAIIKRYEKYYQKGFM